MAQGRRRELRPVVRANVLGHPARDAELGETGEHALRVQPPCNVDRQALPRVLVDDREHPHWPAVDGAVEGEIVRPDVVRSLRAPVPALRAQVR